MFGCCGMVGQKFKNKDGKVDTDRLVKILKSIDSEEQDKGLVEKYKDQVRKCDCPCHHDGSIVLC